MFATRPDKPLDVAQKNESDRSDAKAKPTDWSKHRKAFPLNRILDRTLQWSDSLPETVRPHALLKLYPRIANTLAASWQDASALDVCFRDLFFDKRGDRRGFPKAVAEELHKLEQFYQAPVYTSNREKHVCGIGGSIYWDGMP